MEDQSGGRAAGEVGRRWFWKETRDPAGLRTSPVCTSPSTHATLPSVLCLSWGV